MAWARRMDEGPNQGKNEEPGRDWTIFRRPDEKKGAGGLAGLMAGDALTRPFANFCFLFDLYSFIF
jgi:hypothetical protein